MKQVFLSYARDDTTKARRLVRDLSADRRVRVWFDREEILSGMRWRPAIRKAIRESDFFIALLSRKSVSSRGVRHVELREALDVLDEFPTIRYSLIPARLDECPVPIDRMEELDYADLFPRWDEGLQRIPQVLWACAVAQRGRGRATDNDGHTIGRRHACASDTITAWRSSIWIGASAAFRASHGTEPRSETLRLYCRAGVPRRGPRARPSTERRSSISTACRPRSMPPSPDEHRFRRLPDRGAHRV
jgi:hypothetical protein